MHIRLEREEQGFEIDCGCGTRFMAPYKSHHATCPACGAVEVMPALFDEWWRAEPTCGRYAYREA